MFRTGLHSSDKVANLEHQVSKNAQTITDSQTYQTPLVISFCFTQQSKLVTIIFPFNYTLHNKHESISKWTIQEINESIGNFLQTDCTLSD